MGYGRTGSARCSPKCATHCVATDLLSCSSRRARADATIDIDDSAPPRSDSGRAPGRPPPVCARGDSGWRETAASGRPASTGAWDSGRRDHPHARPGNGALRLGARARGRRIPPCASAAGEWPERAHGSRRARSSVVAVPMLVAGAHPPHAARIEVLGRAAASRGMVRVPDADPGKDPSVSANRLGPGQRTSRRCAAPASQSCPPKATSAMKSRSRSRSVLNTTAIFRSRPP